MAEYNKKSTEESPDTQTFAPSKIDCIVKAALCLLVGIIPLLNTLGTAKDGRSRIFFVGVGILLLYIFVRFLIRMINRLTISKNGICFEGRTGLFLLHKRIELSHDNYDYCRTRRIYYDRYGRSYLLFLDFFDTNGSKIKTIRIDYFDFYDNIVKTLDELGKLDKDKCITPGVYEVKTSTVILSTITAIVVVIAAILIRTLFS